jgi:hypothetical protein
VWTGILFGAHTDVSSGNARDISTAVEKTR